MTTNDKTLIEYTDSKILKRLYLMASDTEEHRGLVKYSTIITEEESLETYQALLECFAKWETIPTGQYRNFSARLQQMQRRPQNFVHFFRPPRPDSIGGISSRGPSPRPSNNMSYNGANGLSPHNLTNLNGVAPIEARSISPNNLSGNLGNNKGGLLSNAFGGLCGAVGERGGNSGMIVDHGTSTLSNGMYNGNQNMNGEMGFPPKMNIAPDISNLPQSYVSEQGNFSPQMNIPGNTQINNLRAPNQPQFIQAVSQRNASAPISRSRIPGSESNALQPPQELLQNIAAMALVRTSIISEVSDASKTSFTYPAIRSLFTQIEDLARKIRGDPYWVGYIEGKNTPPAELQRKAKSELGFFDDCAQFMKDPSESLNDKVGFLYDFSTSMKKHFDRVVDIDSKIAAIVEGPSSSSIKKSSPSLDLYRAAQDEINHERGIEFNTSADEFEAQMRMMNQQNRLESDIRDRGQVSYVSQRSNVNQKSQNFQNPQRLQGNQTLPIKPSSHSLKNPQTLSNSKPQYPEYEDTNLTRTLKEKDREIQDLKLRLAESQVPSRQETNSNLNTSRNYRKYSFLNPGPESLKPRSMTPSYSGLKGRKAEGSSFVDNMFNEIEYNLNKKHLRGYYGFSNA